VKTSTLERNGVSTEMVDLIGRLIELIAWPARRRAMGDVTMALLDGKRRVAEDVFGWNRKAVELGIVTTQVLPAATKFKRIEAEGAGLGRSR